MSTTTAAKDEDRSSLERLLGVFTDVRAQEGVTALLLLVNVFLLLSAYYIIKPVRDALITAMPNGPEYKSYMSAAIAVGLLGAVPLYARYAKGVSRNRLVVGVTLFFVSHIALFAIGTSFKSTESWLPLVFYLWVGIFNMMVVAQFWAFANDVYTEEQGKRLFPLVGIGASGGAVAGAALAKLLPERTQGTLEGGCNAASEKVGFLNTWQLLLLSAAILASCALLTQIVHVREVRAKQRRATEPRPPDDEQEAEQLPDEKKADEKKAKAQKGQGAYEMVWRHRYLTLLAAFSLLFTLVNTNGEYLISKLVKEWVEATMAQCQFPNEATEKAFKSGQFTSWYGDFYFYVNVFGVILQSFIVSRLVKYGGLKLSFFIFPVIALFGAAAVAMFPLLAVLRTSKIAENSTDYSINNTVRNMLWLPTTRAMKYRAKQAVDTFFVRMGDVSSAGLVLLMGGVLGLGVRAFAITNLVLIVAWLMLARAILREQKVLKKMRDSGELRDDDEPAAEAE